MKQIPCPDNDATTIAAQLAAGKTAYAFTKGCSMQPLLYAGKTHVILQPLSRPLKVGDLPIYLRPDGIYVIHRLIAMDEQTYVTLGDNCITAETIPKDRVIGVVSEIHRKGRYVSVESRSYRCYVWLWMHTRKVRIFIKKCIQKAGRWKHD